MAHVRITGSSTRGQDYRNEPLRAPLSTYIARSACASRSAAVAPVGREHGHADRGPQLLLAERRGEPVAHAVDEVGHRPGAVLEVGQHEHELVAAEPGHEVALTHAAPQPGGHLAQRRVPGRVPARVVDGLEAVEVEHHHADRARARARPGQRRVQRPLERAPVREPRQHVGVGLVARAPVLLHARGHVVVGRDRAVLGAVAVVERVGVHLHPQQRAVPAHEAHDLPAHLLAPERPHQRQPVLAQQVPAVVEQVDGDGAQRGRPRARPRTRRTARPRPRWPPRRRRPCRPRPRPPAGPRGSRG